MTWNVVIYVDFNAINFLNIHNTIFSVFEQEFHYNEKYIESIQQEVQYFFILLVMVRRVNESCE